MKIKYDSYGNVKSPTFVLATKYFEKLGIVKYYDYDLSDHLLNGTTITFKVDKYYNGKLNHLWDNITDFKLLWWKDEDLWFEISTEIIDNIDTVKFVKCIGLSRSELSQTKVHDIEINTEKDIAREEYKESTVFCNTLNPKASLLHRLLYKNPQFTIGYVDTSIAKMQRTFSFNNQSVLDAFNEIQKECECLFVFDDTSNSKKQSSRIINVYDLKTQCKKCGNRFEKILRCPKCGSTNLKDGYGIDTTVFLEANDLTDSIHLTKNTSAVKNCFKLIAGDELMTASIKSCNANGTDYIWYFSDEFRSEMSKDLSKKLQDYNELQDRYNIKERIDLSSTTASQFNNLVDKYKSYDTKLEKISSSAIGYTELINTYYNTIDMNLFLKSGLMPIVKVKKTKANTELRKITNGKLSSVAVSNKKYISKATIDSVVTTTIRTLISSQYKIKVLNSRLSSNLWYGKIELTNYSDENDKATSSLMRVSVTDDLETFVKQRIENVLHRIEDKDYSIVGLFKFTLPVFKEELHKYGLKRLQSFHDACQSCIDVLIEHGVGNSTHTLYEKLYKKYYDKLQALEKEILDRENEIQIVENLNKFIEDKSNEIHNILNLEKFLGEELWKEFSSYRREEVYNNSNYISDGLTNKELLDKAIDFIDKAKSELYKSGELQYNIDCDLNNIISQPRYVKLKSKINLGDWLRCKIDGEIYKFRLINYKFSSSSTRRIPLEFSDTYKTTSGMYKGLTDTKELLQKATTMANSYSYVQHQAEKGSKGNAILNDWVQNGLDLTNKSISNSDNQQQTWDNHGFLFRQYDATTDTYDKRQIKIINSTIAMTNDNWQTCKVGIGEFVRYDFDKKEYVKDFGVIADTIVADIVLSKKTRIVNPNNDIKIDEDGFTLTTNTEGRNAFTIQKKTEHGIEKQLYIDDDGNLTLGAGSKISWLADTDFASKSDLDKFATKESLSNLSGTTLTNSTISSPNLLGGHILIGNKDNNGNYFEVNKDGVLDCKGGKFRGNIEATSFSLAPSVDTTTLPFLAKDRYYRSRNINISTNDIRQSENNNVSQFYVSPQGQLVCNNALIRGDIYANNGEFRGTVYANNGEFRGTVNATTMNAYKEYKIYDGDVGKSVSIIKTEFYDNNTKSLYVGYDLKKTDNYMLRLEESTSYDYCSDSLFSYNPNDSGQTLYLKSSQRIVLKSNDIFMVDSSGNHRINPTESGYVAFYTSPDPNGITYHDVTFDSPFDDVPIVLVSLKTGSPNTRLVAACTPFTRSGFRIALYNTEGFVKQKVYYVAIGGKHWQNNEYGASML